MRGKIDLSWHKLAGLYRPPVRSSKQRRKRMPKMPGGNRGVYWIIWRIVDGAVRDCFERHPEYLTDAGRMSAQLSITKRVTGALMGYAVQAAQCRSVGQQAATAEAVDASRALKHASADAAARSTAPELLRAGHTGPVANWTALWARVLRHLRPCRWSPKPTAEIQRETSPETVDRVARALMSHPEEWDFAPSQAKALLRRMACDAMRAMRDV